MKTSRKLVSLLALLAVSLLQGCASVVSHVDLPNPMTDCVSPREKDPPPPYYGTVDDFDLTWTCIVSPASEKGERGDGHWPLVFVTPLPFVDGVLSSVLDTLLLPLDLANYDGKAEYPAAKRTLKILKASYGEKDAQIDVTEKLRSMLKDGKLDIVVNDALFSYDAPASKHSKRFLRVEYSYRGMIASTTYGNKQRVKLPVPPVSLK